MSDRQLQTAGREYGPARNDPCTGGSGRKWKRCHGTAACAR
jgi:uncharacterized protein YecA (UPF0149 family)